MKKYNKYGAADKNITTFDTEIISEYKGQKLPDDLLMIKCYTKKDECHVAFIPDYENQRVGTTMDKDNEFATSVLQWLIDSGTAERLMKEIHNLLWGNAVQNTASKESLQYELKLPKLHKVN